MADIVSRLDQKIITGPGCWQWTASTGKGYGQIFHQGRLAAAHRVVYEMLVGPIPEGLYLDHLCRNRGCVNPAHLEPVTHAENVRRGLAGKINNARSAQTECKRGHSLHQDSGNLYLNGGKRHCRICRKLHKAQARAKQQKGKTQ